MDFMIKILLVLSMLATGAVLAVLFYRIYLKGVQLQKANFGTKVYEGLEGTFRSSKVINYQKLQSWLKAKGAEHFCNGFGDPFQFLAVNAGAFLVMMVFFGWIFDMVTAIPLSVGLIAVEVMVIISRDKKDNLDMLHDVAFLYDATAIQLTSHIYAAQAIYNCIQYIRNKRLKQALSELCTSLMLGGDVRNATQDFCEKFDNTYLETYCNAIVQITAETGEVGHLIEDMSQQLTALKETTFAVQKKSAENRLQICIIGIFLVFTALIFYLSIVSMVGSADMMLG